MFKVPIHNEIDQSIRLEKKRNYNYIIVHYFISLVEVDPTSRKTPYLF